MVIIDLVRFIQFRSRLTSAIEDARSQHLMAYAKYPHHNYSFDELNSGAGQLVFMGRLGLVWLGRHVPSRYGVPVAHRHPLSVETAEQFLEFMKSFEALEKPPQL